MKKYFNFLWKNLTILKFNQNLKFNFTQRKMSKPIKEGWMTKQGGSYKSWKKRWFTLVDTTLTYYPDQKAKKEKGKIDLKKATGVDDAPEEKKKPNKAGKVTKKKKQRNSRSKK